MIASYRATTTAEFRALAERTAGNPDKFVRALVTGVADEMSRSGWGAGCVAQTLAQELAPGDTEIVDALAALFDDWVEIIAAALAFPQPSASVRRRAVALIAALEGARTMARAQRSAAPFDAIVGQFTG